VCSVWVPLRPCVFRVGPLWGPSFRWLPPFGPSGVDRLITSTARCTSHSARPALGHPRYVTLFPIVQVRFNAFRPDALVSPLPQFVSESRPPAYSPVKMATHMETTMRNLADGVGSWDRLAQRSLSASYDYERERG